MKGFSKATPLVSTWQGLIDGKPARRTKLSFVGESDTHSFLMDWGTVKELVCKLSANAGFRHRAETFLPEGNSLSGVPFLPVTKAATAESAGATKVGDTELAQHVKAQLESNPDWMPDWRPDDEF